MGFGVRQGSRSRVYEATRGEYTRHPSDARAPVYVAWLDGAGPGLDMAWGVEGSGGGRDGDATGASGTYLARSTVRAGATATPTFMQRDAIVVVVDQRK